MNNTAHRPIPDGRMRIKYLLSENQKLALTRLKTEGLIMLNRTEVDFTPPETWIEYWFDKNTISESSLRLQIQEAINNSK